MNPEHELPTAPSDLVKLRIPLPKDEWHGHVAELVWAEPLGSSRYRIRNVPFFAFGLALDDVVKVSAGTGIATVRSGGHSTYRVFFSTSVKDKQEWLSRLESSGTSFERATERLYAIDVPPHVNLAAVYRLLKDGAGAGVWDFDEGHVGQDVTSHRF